MRRAGLAAIGLLAAAAAAQEPARPDGPQAVYERAAGAILSGDHAAFLDCFDPPAREAIVRAALRTCRRPGIAEGPPEVESSAAFERLLARFGLALDDADDDEALRRVEDLPGLLGALLAWARERGRPIEPWRAGRWEAGEVDGDQAVGWVRLAWGSGAVQPVEGAVGQGTSPGRIEEVHLVRAGGVWRISDAAAARPAEGDSPEACFARLAAAIEAGDHAEAHRALGPRTRRSVLQAAARTAYRRAADRPDAAMALREVLEANGLGELRVDEPPPIDDWLAGSTDRADLYAGLVGLLDAAAAPPIDLGPRPRLVEPTAEGASVRAWIESGEGEPVLRRPVRFVRPRARWELELD